MKFGYFMKILEKSKFQNANVINANFEDNFIYN